MPERISRCRCCELPVGSCGRAVEQRRRAEHAAERKRLLATPGVYQSEYTLDCPECGDFFRPGTPIARNAQGAWSHCAAERRATA